MRELSLFTGYAGFSLGLRIAGLPTKTIGYCDNDKYIQKLLQARIKDGYIDDAPIISDIRADWTPYRGLVDIITAGFPCQPHSHAGKRKGEADERNLWPDTRRCISEVEPRFVLLENVPGIISNGYAGVVAGELSEIGYDAVWGLVSAADIGASHLRKRWWCFAWLGNTQHDGRTPFSQFRCDEEASSNSSEEQAQTWESQGTDRSTDATSIRRGKNREQLADSQHKRYEEGVQPKTTSNRGRQIGDMADSEIREPWQSQAWDRGKGTQRRSEQLADSSIGRHRESKEKIRTGGNPTEYGIGQLADSDTERYRGWSSTERGDGERFVQSEEQGRSEVGSETKGCNRDMADSERQRGCSRATYREDAEDVGQPPQPERPSRHVQSEEQGRSEMGSETKGCNRDMADSECFKWGNAHGHQSGDSTEGTRERQPDWIGGSSESADDSTWPPGPSDRDAWERVIRERPDLAPAITKEAECQFRGVDDGTSNRVDRLKACGNGIVPAVVAEFLRRIGV